MKATLHPWQLLSVILAGLLNEQQQRVIENLKEEKPEPQRLRRTVRAINPG